MMKKIILSLWFLCSIASSVAQGNCSFDSLTAESNSLPTSKLNSFSISAPQSERVEGIYFTDISSSQKNLTFTPFNLQKIDTEFLKKDFNFQLENNQTLPKLEFRGCNPLKNGISDYFETKEVMINRLVDKSIERLISKYILKNNP